MYALMQAMPFKQLVIEQVPIILVSMIIAEMFYKFHSFTLEAIAFLVTWYLLDNLAQFVLKQFKPKK